MGQPTFIISLDFELHWGRFDKLGLEENLPYYLKTRENIPRLLALFEKYGIHATWATVGSLMASGLEEWRSYWPEQLPTYTDKKFSAYQWMEKDADQNQKALFAPELVKMISQSPGQEIGCHTFSHYYTRTEGQSLAQYEADILAAKKIAMDKFGLDLKSMVFPRNQYDQEIIEMTVQNGLKILRTNPNDWFWNETSKETLVKKAFRTGDSLFNLGKCNHYPLTKMGDTDYLLLPASRFFRLNKGFSWVDNLKIEKIKNEMSFAASEGHVYHLWWHPHNLSNNPKSSFRSIEKVLNHFINLRNSTGMISENMQEVYEKRLLTK